MVDYLAKNYMEFFDRRDRFENVIIIGAGFSKAFGLPLTNELLPECIAFCKSKDYDGLKRDHPWLSDYPARLQETLNWFYGPATSLENLPNIESYRKLAELADFPDGPNERILDLFKYTSRLIALYLNLRADEVVREDKAAIPKLRQLLQDYKGRSTIVSLNYDLILELLGFGEAFDIHYDHLIKLHGSTDLQLVTKPFPFMSEITREFRDQDIPGIESLGLVKD